VLDKNSLRHSWMEKKRKEERQKGASDRSAKRCSAGWRFLTAPLRLQTPPQPAVSPRPATLQPDKHRQREMPGYPASPTVSSLTPPTSSRPPRNQAFRPCTGTSTLSPLLPCWFFFPGVFSSYPLQLFLLSPGSWEMGRAMAQLHQGKDLLEITKNICRAPRSPSCT